ncbi:translocator protein isoform X2 [Pelecanus crispus]
MKKAHVRRSEDERKTSTLQGGLSHLAQKEVVCNKMSQTRRIPRHFVLSSYPNGAPEEETYSNLRTIPDTTEQMEFNISSAAQVGRQLALIGDEFNRTYHRKFEDTLLDLAHGFTVSMEVASAWAPAVGFTLLPHAGGLLGSKITKKEIPVWYQSLQKPSWCPPNWVFAPVWGTLYTSMGYGSYLVWKELGGFNEKSVVPLGLYAGQLALNWAWTPIFFGAHKMGWGLVTLLLTTGTATATTASWYNINKTAAYLMVPYLAWLTMASALNYRIWNDNRNKKQPE